MSIDLSETHLTLKASMPDGSVAVFDHDLFSDVVPDDYTLRVVPVKVELKLKKKKHVHWESVIKPDPEAATPAPRPQRTQKDWDKLCTFSLGHASGGGRNSSPPPPHPLSRHSLPILLSPPPFPFPFPSSFSSSASSFSSSSSPFALLFDLLCNQPKKWRKRRRRRNLREKQHCSSSSSKSTAMVRMDGIATPQNQATEMLSRVLIWRVLLSCSLSLSTSLCALGFFAGNEDVKRAMMKSYVESNGTVLSTNWDEVKQKTVL